MKEGETTVTWYPAYLECAPKWKVDPGLWAVRSSTGHTLRNTYVTKKKAQKVADLLTGGSK